MIAGQGTAAAELLEELPDLDALLVPTGGGGLLSGCAVAARHMAPRCRVIGIEPELADDATRSFRTGVLARVVNPKTIADGLRTPSLGEHTFPLVRGCVYDMRTVTEAAIATAVHFYFYRMKLVVEPSGAVTLAGAMNGAADGARRVGVIVSGGNVDGAVRRPCCGRRKSIHDAVAEALPPLSVPDQLHRQASGALLAAMSCAPSSLPRIAAACCRDRHRR